MRYILSMNRILTLLFLCAALLGAQTNFIQAYGSASISVVPDQASLTMGVVTQGSTAQEAAQQNAVQTTAMIAALNAAVGKSGTVQTVAYSVTPRYAASSGTNTLIGYTATNTVQVVTTNLTLIGPIIDAGYQAGGNSISGVSFGLQNSDPVVLQALAQASKQALSHAAAIAGGLGAKTGSVLSAVEGSSVTPYRTGDSLSAGATSTPIQTGTVSVSANVTVSVLLVQ
jgi:uncharacterized protein